jgi:membrane fusion protein
MRTLASDPCRTSVGPSVLGADGLASAGFIVETTGHLFREQALAARSTKTLGSVVLMRPVSFTLLTSGCALLAMGLAALLVLGSYTRRTTVAGRLVPDSGLLKLYAGQSGQIVERHVIEGQVVHAGDPLFVISIERQSATQGPTQAAVSGQLEQRASSLREQREQTRSLQRAAREALTHKIADTQSELAALGGAIAGQRERSHLAQMAHDRYQELLARQYVSQEQAQQKVADALDQEARGAALEREQIALKRELASQQAELAVLPMKQSNELAEIDRAIDDAAAALSESEAKRRLVVSAPAEGLASAVQGELGQWVDASRPLVTIVPADSPLHAELYAPSRAIGFVAPGDVVLMRLAAFPYQKFGHQRGTVETVALTALSAGELTAGASTGNAASQEPLYRISVRLASQSVLAYGQKRVLEAGMLLEADILQERRRLYEWVLEPLYSVSGKL